MPVDVPSPDVATLAGDDRDLSLSPIPTGYAVLEGATSVHATAPGLAGRLTVRRISPDGAWLETPAGVHVAVGQRLRLQLVAGYREYGPLSCVAEGYLPGHERVLAVRFMDIQRGDGEAIYALLRTLRARGQTRSSPTVPVVVEQIASPPEVERWIRALVSHGCEGVVRLDHDVSWPLVDVRCASDGDRPLSWRLRGPPVDAPFRVEIVGFNSVFRWLVRDAFWSGGHMATALPQRVERLRHRWRRRAPSPTGLAVAFHHPLWPQVDLCRRVRDVGALGIAFWTFAEDDLMYPGLHVPRLEVVYNGEVVCEGEALVRHTTELPPILQGQDADEVFCGVSFRPRGGGDTARWQNLVNQLLSPGTRSGATWSEFSWEAYERSGYFHLSGKSPAQFASLRDSFAHVSRGLDAAPWIGCQAVWPSDRGVEATFTFIKAYGGCWLGFQLAKTPGSASLRVPSRRILRELYIRVFEHMQHDSALRWVAGYLDASVRWNHVAQFAYASQHEATGQACLIPIVLLEASSAERPESATRSAGFEVAVASEGEVRALLGHLAATRPLPYTLALDLTPEAVTLTSVIRAWTAAGFDRRRVILAARREGRLCAAAVVETGQTGASLFNLLDSVRLYAIAPGGDAAFPALLDAARIWYRGIGKDVFVVLNEDWDRHEAVRHGLTDLGDGRLWIIARALLPDFLERIRMLLAPKDRS